MANRQNTKLRKPKSSRALTRPQKLAATAALLMICASFFLPFMWMFSTSIKPKDQLLETSPTWVPRQWEAPVGEGGAWVAVEYEGREITEEVYLVRKAGESVSQILPLSRLTEQHTHREKIAASADEPFAPVRRKLGDKELADWQVVPVDKLRKRFAPQWQNYPDVINDENMIFPLFARNTLIIALLGVTGTLVSSSLVAYGFAKIDFRGSKLLFAVMLATMMIPFPVIMVPMFAIFRWMGEHNLGQWLGTFKPLWVPMWFGSAFNIFLLRQFFRTLPDELSEAARIDGCSELGIFLRIALPLSKPALAVVALFTFMFIWNDFLGPLVYLQDQQQYTLVLGLQTFQSQHEGSPYNLVMAASVLIFSPIIVLFFLTQKTFIEGIATTGMKG